MEGTDTRSVVPVILSGGNGTRLWPMSRDTYPKQLLPLLDEVSLLQQTAWRVRGFESPLVVCREEQRFLVAEQLAALAVQPADVVLEPVPRGTAPAVAAAAMMVQRDHPGSLMLVCPTDHAIQDIEAFRSDVAAAASTAEHGHLVSFGERLPAWQGSGIFLFQPALLLEELGRFEPAVCTAVTAALETAQRELDFLRLGEDAFASSPALSVDAAVMQRTQKATEVDARFSWDEVGSWSGLWRMSEHDGDGNVRLGDVVSRDTRGCYLRGEGVLLATVGLTDAVVVATKDAVLVAARSADDDVKELVQTLRARGRPEASAHRVVYRPWGCSETVHTGPGWQIAHITVKPRQQLPLEKHAFRAEHWVVISGTAEVVRGEDTTLLEAGMSVDVPGGCLHRLGNPGPEILQMVEVRTGSYVGDDDVVPLADVILPEDPASAAPRDRGRSGLWNRVLASPLLALLRPE